MRKQKGNRNTKKHKYPFRYKLIAAIMWYRKHSCCEKNFLLLWENLNWCFDLAYMASFEPESELKGDLLVCKVMRWNCQRASQHGHARTLIHQPPTMSHFLSFEPLMLVKILGSHPRVKSHRRTRVPKQLGTLWELISRSHFRSHFPQTYFMTSKRSCQIAPSLLAKK